MIFSTKYREAYLKDEPVTETLYQYLGGVLNGKKCQALAIGGAVDHIHILADFRRDIAIPEVVKEVKRGSSIWVKAQSDSYHNFAWQGGYV